MFELKDYQQILAEKAAAVEPFFEKYPDADALAKSFANINATKIRTVEPEIMVYGIYNAGKSSILNELMGADKARVEDVPTTDSVDYYDWQGYKIADTPGIFAPIEHEEVTEAHLKKADIVLFVMSTTGSNEKAENYQRMKAIADAGKKIIIVLNDKNGDLGRRDDVIQTIKQKVDINMRQVGIDNVDEKYCIVTVNAARARKGRVENKPTLVAKSGLDELKDVVLSELKRTTSFDILRGGIRQLEGVLEDFIKSLEASENSALIKKMNQVLETFTAQKISMRRQINTYIDTQAEMLGETLPQIIWSNRENQSQINEIIAQEIERLNGKIQREIQRQLQDTAAVLSLELKSFAEIKIDAQSVDAEAFKNILAQLSAASTETSTALATVPEKSSEFDISTIGIATGLLTQSGAEIAKHLAKTEIGKALAGTVLGRVAGSVVPVIGPLITIVSIVGALGKFLGNNDDHAKLEAQIQEQNRAERRRVEAEMQARQEIGQKCRYLADNIADELKTAADASVTEILAKYEEPFKTEIASRKAEGEQISADILKLREIHNEYDLLRVELGAR
ncbi:MAG: 50S ribosome-binding GTPase [Selenomonadaceae bacterium]|nr:50S ribosome-binding GTPase [Selenomonadaceae bacterium]